MTTKRIEIEGASFKKNELEHNSRWIANLIERVNSDLKSFQEDPIKYIEFWRLEYDYFFDNVLQKLHLKIGLLNRNIYWFLAGFICGYLSTNINNYFEKIAAHKNYGIIIYIWIEYLIKDASDSYALFKLDPLKFISEHFIEFNQNLDGLLFIALGNSKKILYEDLVFYVWGFLVSQCEKGKFLENFKN